MQPHEDEQILTEHLMVVQSAAQALLVARHAVDRRIRESHTRPSQPAQQTSPALENEPPAQNPNENTPSAATADPRYDREELIARWAAAEAVRERAVSDADAWSERMSNAGMGFLDRISDKTIAAASRATAGVQRLASRLVEVSRRTGQRVSLAVAERKELLTHWLDARSARTSAIAEADAWTQRMHQAGIDTKWVKKVATDLEATATTGAKSAAGVRNSVVERMTEQFVDAGLGIEAGRSPQESEKAEPVAADSGADVDEGKTLTERLRGTVSDTALDSPDANWKLADQTFELLIGQGTDPGRLVDAARHCLNGAEAVASMDNVVQRRKEQVEAAALGRLMAATAFARTNAPRGSDPAPQLQPTTTGTQKATEVGAEL